MKLLNRLKSICQVKLFARSNRRRRKGGMLALAFCAVLLAFYYLWRFCGSSGRKNSSDHVPRSTETLQSLLSALRQGLAEKVES